LGVFLFVMYRRTARVRHVPRVVESEPRRLETAVMAGFVATLEMALGTNAIMYVLSALGFHESEPPLIRLATRTANRYFDGDIFRATVMLIALLFVGGAIWAIVYAHVADPFLPGPSWLRGLTFGIVPLLFSLVILLPAVGGGFFGLALGAGGLPIAGEVVRNALFGLGLGTSYTLLRIARQPPARAVPALDSSDVSARAESASIAAAPPRGE
jgi:hypothetical protein